MRTACSLSYGGGSLYGGRGSLARLGGSLSRGVSVRGGLCPEGISVQVGLCQEGSMSRGGLCPGGLCPGVPVQCEGSLSRGLSGGLCLGGLCLGGLCLGVSVWGSLSGGSLSGGSLSGGVSVQGESLSGWSLSAGSPSRGGSPSRVVSVQGLPYRDPLPLWTESQTGVKTLPCRNFVADGNNRQYFSRQHAPSGGSTVY